MRPDPHDMSTTTPPDAEGEKKSDTSANSFSIPGKPALLKFCRQPRSYRKPRTGERNICVWVRVANASRSSSANCARVMPPPSAVLPEEASSST
eukprot:scaffold8264_cov109-Isochrysis_galbana.AAC.5